MGKLILFRISHVNIVINLLNIRCVHVELHAIKNGFLRKIYMAFCATTLKIVTMA
jgi:hypothetical protein